MTEKASPKSMWFKKILLLLAIILFPWLAIPAGLYYLWRWGAMKRLLDGGARALKKLRGWAVTEDQIKLDNLTSSNCASYFILPRALGVQYIYTIEVRDRPERLADYSGDLAKSMANLIRGRGRALISMVISDSIKCIRIHIISRLLLGLSGSVEREVEEVALRVADSLRSKSPTSKVKICVGKDIIKNPILEGCH
ncbi:MAG: hypothetical protein ACUVQ5_03180 [Candidatus Methanomethylicaceae archaeon]